jgi:hypothetical protein
VALTRVKDFLQTLTEKEKIELIEEVRKIIELRNTDSNNTKDKKEKSFVEFTYMDDY